MACLNSTTGGRRDGWTSFGTLRDAAICFAWRWAREHPGEAIHEVLRNRVDLCRKTDPAPADYDIATLDFTRPAWIELENQLTAVYAGAQSAAAFETQAMAASRPLPG